MYAYLPGHLCSLVASWPRMSVGVERPSKHIRLDLIDTYGSDRRRNSHTLWLQLAASHRNGVGCSLAKMHPAMQLIPERHLEL